MMDEAVKCLGMRRYGGAFDFGRPRWVQCEEDAIAILKCVQDGEIGEFPACAVCWNEALERGIKIIKATIILAKEGEL